MVNLVTNIELKEKKYSEKYILKNIYIVISKLQPHINMLGIDVRVAFPVADFISSASVLDPYRIANRNVTTANIAKVMVQCYSLDQKTSVCWRPPLQRALVAVLSIFSGM